MQRIRHARGGVVRTEEYNELVDLVNTLATAPAAPNMEMRSIGGKPAYASIGGTGVTDGIWVKITGSTLIAAPNDTRYTYSWAEVEWTGAGYSGWTTKTAGRTGTNNAYNLAEVPLKTFRFRPVPNDTIVLLHQIRTTVYWFNGDENADTNVSGTYVTIVHDPDDKTVDTDTWDITVNDGNGVKVKFLTAVVYNATDHVLYQKYRMLTFDDGGRLIAVGGETQDTVTNFVSCVVA